MKIIDGNIPEQLRSVLRASGDRKIIFVEGKTDDKIYNWLFKSFSSTIYFRQCGSKLNAIENFDTAKNYLIEKSVYAIVDKDFDSEELVEDCFNDNKKPFRLSWFSIENYLLNDNAIIEGGNIFSDLGKFSIKNGNEVENYLKQLCEKLLPFSAAHKISMKHGEKMPGIGQPDLDTYVESLATKTNTTTEEIKLEINQQIEEWQSENEFWELADYFKLICGKRIIHFLHKDHNLIPAKKFKNFLAYHIAANNEIPENLLDILHQILKA